MEFSKPKHYTTTPNSESGVKIVMYDPSRKCRHTPEQVKYLEECYKNDPRPSTATRNEIATLLNLSPRMVQIWFQNKRAKSKSSNLSQSNININLNDYIPNRGDVISISNLLNNEVTNSNLSNIVMSSSPDTHSKTNNLVFSDIHSSTNYSLNSNMNNDIRSSSSKTSSFSIDNLLI